MFKVKENVCKQNKITTCISHSPDIVKFSHDKNIYPIPNYTHVHCILRCRVFIFILRKINHIECH